MQPFDFTRSVTASGIRFLGSKHAVTESKATRDGKRAYIQMCLPGYSEDGAEAVVHVGAAEGNHSTYLDILVCLYYLNWTGTGWKVVGYRLLLQT